jgi:hypothetical protein
MAINKRFACVKTLAAYKDAIAKVVVRRFGAREIAPQGQEVESTSTS